MKKLIIIITAAVIACAGVVVLMEANSAGAGLQLTTYKCYKARHAKRSPRFQPERVFVTDQFRHNIEVSVLKLNTHCSTANQELFYDGTAAGFQVGLNCYSIRDVPRQPRFTPQNIEVRDKLTNWNDQTLTVSRVQSLCVRSEKSQFSGSLEGDSFVCYQAKTAKGEPRFQQRDMQIWDNYDPSGKDVRVIRPVAYCSRSEKKVDARNDDFEDRRQLNENDLQYGYFFEDHSSTVHATLENNDPIVSCKTDYTHSVWYEWTGATNNSLMISTDGTTYDTVVAVFTGDKGDLDEVGCNDDVDLCQFNVIPGGAGCCPAGTDDTAGCPIPATSFLQFDAWAGTTYHILVASSDGRGGKLKFEILRKNDAGDANSCGDPLSINQLYYVGDYTNVHISTMNATVPTSSGVSVAGGTCSNVTDPNPSCAGTFGASVWLTYTPPAHQTLNFDASESSYPNVITIYQANDATKTELACGNGFATAQLKTGVKYLIMVGSTDVDNNYRGGKLKLRVTVKDQLGSIVGGESAGVTDQGTPDSLTCYQVRQPRHSNETAYITDQFSIRQLDFGARAAFGGPGFWTLTIGGVDSICVPSNKETCTGYNLLNGVGEAAQLCGG